MRNFVLMALLILYFSQSIKINALEFPPELLWWINEVKKINQNVSINDFKFSNKETIKIGVDDYYQKSLIYPVFMRWNYSGNSIAYYNYHNATLYRQNSGKYIVGDFDDGGFLFIADKNKHIIFLDHFGISEGLNSIHWLTDSVLVGVGTGIYSSERVDLYIIFYKINLIDNIIEKSIYVYENALKNENRFQLKLDWFQQRPDYFEND